MNIHFNNRVDAVFHLVSNGWKELSNGRFISRDGSCIAQINKAFGDVVCVGIWQK